MCADGIIGRAFQQEMAYVLHPVVMKVWAGHGKNVMCTAQPHVSGGRRAVAPAKLHLQPKA